MEIIFLGTTAAVPTASRNHAAIALRYEDEIILWDCGEGTQRQLIRASISYMRIQKIFITHFHGDHFLGLPGLLQTMSFSDRKDPLMIYGPRGIEKVMNAVLNLGEYRLSFEVVPVEISDGFQVAESKYRITAHAVDHYVPSYALVFEEVKKPTFLRAKAEELGVPKGPMFSRLHSGESVTLDDGTIITPDMVLGEPRKGFKVVYTSDTRPQDIIVERSKDAVLIHDSTFDADYLEHALDTRHSTCVEAARTARDAGALALYLTHISPRYKKGEALYDQVKDIFENTVVASDLMTVDLKRLMGATK